MRPVGIDVSRDQARPEANCGAAPRLATKSAQFSFGMGRAKW
jgi:hypothetical protein